MKRTDHGPQIAAHIDATRWSDAASREALQQLVDSVTELVGFDVAVINLVRRTTMTTVTVSANRPEVRAQLLGADTPFSLIQTELDRAERHGRLRFVPAEQVGAEVMTWGWRTDEAPLDSPDAWLTEDLLFAPLYDEAGALIGLLSTDMPVDGLRPGPATYALLERYAHHAERALRSALQREQVAQQVRLTETARHLVRAASSHATLEKVLEESHAPLAEGFGSLGTWIQVFDVHGTERGEAVLTDGSRLEIPADLVRIAHEAAEQLWAEQEAAVTGPTYAADTVIAADERERVHAFLAQAGIDSTMFVPLGAGQDTFGILVLGRWATDPRWSQVEAISAMDIGRDLGAAILNARAFERERRLVRDLQNLDAYKSQLIATVSHELKSPLTAIMGNLELLATMDEVPSSIRESVAAMSRGATRLTGLINDLLLLARVESQAQQRLDVVDLGEVTSGVVDRFEESGVSQIRLVAPAGLEVIGDAEELERLIATLLTNAVAYGGRHITVRVEGRGAEVVVQVADDGIGVSDSELPRIFDEFFRSSDPAVLEQPGAGLGLSIAARIAERHGGTIIAASTLGQGSSFCTTFPASKPPTPPSRNN